MFILFYFIKKMGCRCTKPTESILILEENLDDIVPSNNNNNKIENKENKDIERKENNEQINVNQNEDNEASIYIKRIQNTPNNVKKIKTILNK